jgi:hypothetical protein
MLARRINPRLIRLHRSYSIEDAAFSLGVHKNSVRGWIRNGLPVMDRTRPLLMHGDELRAYLEAKRKAAQCPCTPGTLYCLKCRKPRGPARMPPSQCHHGQSQGPMGHLRHLDAPPRRHVGHRGHNAGLSNYDQGSARTPRRAAIAPANCYKRRD